ncbi:Amino acid transporter [Leucobacter chromiiresistens]|uniref:Amino acid transporter n=2 Tax=Leucobacter chromiiresistens TaxID=1079994 RepID=A0A1H0Y1T9_9MICO|nr:Amino acid transporter [Leucobacter chromiiresistens]
MTSATHDVSTDETGAGTSAPVTSKTTLKGNMGIGELVMSVLAFSSPLTTVAGTLPVLLIFSGQTAPAIYLLLTLMLVVFSVGFVRMSRSVSNPGGFYAFVTAGLGKPAGLGGALLALVGYVFIGFFAPSLFAITLQGWVVDALNGPDIAWYWYALAIIAVTTFLAYNRIDLSAKVLTTVMILEVVVVVVFDVFAFAHSGGAATGGLGLALPSLTDASIGLALLFAVGNFFGFEATVIYREEVKNPERTIPRATYLAVVGIGVFYAAAAVAYIAFLGGANVQAAAEANTVSLFDDALREFAGSLFADIAVVLLMTSILASMLSIQNIAARYSFSLAVDRVLPRRLARVHPKHRSPHLSALAVGLLWAVATIVFSIIGVPPENIYPVASGSGTFSVLLLLFITSIAIFVFFLRRGSQSGSPVWRTVLAPAISAIFFGGVTLLAIVNFSALIEGSVLLTVIFMSFTFALFLGGIAYAVYLRRRKPEVYARLGRQSV